LLIISTVGSIVKRQIQLLIQLSMDKPHMITSGKRKLLRSSFLILLTLILPFYSFAQGGENSLEFFGAILQISICIFVILPLIFLTFIRIKTHRFLFSVLIYLLSIPNIAWLGYATYENILDPDEGMDNWSYLILICMISTFVLRFPARTQSPGKLAIIE
jgi:hypothetical protein